MTMLPHLEENFHRIWNYYKQDVAIPDETLEMIWDAITNYIDLTFRLFSGGEFNHDTTELIEEWESYYRTGIEEYFLTAYGTLTDANQSELGQLCNDALDQFALDTEYFGYGHRYAQDWQDEKWYEDQHIIKKLSDEREQLIHSSNGKAVQLMQQKPSSGHNELGFYPNRDNFLYEIRFNRKSGELYVLLFLSYDFSFDGNRTRDYRDKLYEKGMAMHHSPTSIWLGDPKNAVDKLKDVERIVTEYFVYLNS